MKNLTDQQLKAVKYLVQGKTYVETSRLLKIDRTTLYSWRQKPEFKEAYAQLDRERSESTYNKIAEVLSSEAFNTLVELFSDNDEASNARIRAIDTLLNMRKEFQPQLGDSETQEQPKSELNSDMSSEDILKKLLDK
ncbi:helix-turn-helix domain-containing protein [Egbenema bharatensis]|uniref:helix-turn-helix domain-containing protein n=1 Tax=Egbenema bharatensis TaxID=3463334 RepID=UPI003A8BFD11